MIGILIVFFLLIGVVALIAVSALKSGNKIKYRTILSDIGLKGAWSEEGKTPFYKWGWRDKQQNRISADRIVKQAFLKVGVWLEREDLIFFEDQCKQFAMLKEIDEAPIHQRILEIIQRSERIRIWVADQVKTAIQSIQILKPQEARDHLHQYQIEVDLDQAPERLAVYEIQRLMYRFGSKILTPNAKGLTVHDPISSQAFLLEKMDSWRHLVRICREEILEFLSGRHFLIQPAIGRALRLSVESGVFREIETDIDRHFSFLRRINDQFYNKEIRVSPERAKTIDSILYQWKFDEGTHFNQNDQNCIRNTLSRLDLASRFRELLFERFDESFSSLFKIVNLFPRDVIFYGGQNAARSFAVDQYSRHFLVLLEAFAGPSGRDISPPTIIWINNEQIDKMRQGPKRGSTSITLDQLLSDRQRISRLEQCVTDEIAANRGWIINLSSDDLSEQDIETLSHGEFGRYVRFDCEMANNVDFFTNTYNAKKSRIQFFNLIVDALAGIPSIPDNSNRSPQTDPNNKPPSEETNSEMEDYESIPQPVSNPVSKN